MEISSVKDDSGQVTTCPIGSGFTLTGALFEASQSFDDGTVGGKGIPLVLRLDGLTTPAIIPTSYPDRAKLENMQGEADVLLTIHGDGTAPGVAIFKSSGSSLLDDQAMSTAKRTAVLPARLPAALGGAPIDALYLLQYVFILDR